MTDVDDRSGVGRRVQIVNDEIDSRTSQAHDQAVRLGVEFLGRDWASSIEDLAQEAVSTGSPNAGIIGITGRDPVEPSFVVPGHGTDAASARK